MQSVIEAARSIRRLIIRKYKPTSRYYLFQKNEKHATSPLSNKYGYDRGTPIDRYYIEQFLNDNAKLIYGRCLEINDNAYTLKYGANRITSSDVLDIKTTNTKATIHGDLRKLTMIPDNTYDTLIITQTINFIDDLMSAFSELHRILKPGGSLLLTAPSLTPDVSWETHLWCFRVNSMKYVLHQFFDPNNVFVRSYGNVLVGQAFWVGITLEDFPQSELDNFDPHYPLIVAAKATKC